MRAQVERKLKKAFDAAYLAHTGSLTRQQASAAGLDFVAGISSRSTAKGTERCGFDEVKRYLIEQGAQLD